MLLNGVFHSLFLSSWPFRNHSVSQLVQTCICIVNVWCFEKHKYYTTDPCSGHLTDCVSVPLPLWKVTRWAVKCDFTYLFCQQLFIFVKLELFLNEIKTHTYRLSHAYLQFTLFWVYSFTQQQPNLFVNSLQITVCESSCVGYKCWSPTRNVDRWHLVLQWVCGWLCGARVELRWMHKQQNLRYLCHSPTSYITPVS